MEMYAIPVEVHRRQFLRLIDDIKGLVLESTDSNLQQSVQPLLEMLTAGIKAAATPNSPTTSISESPAPENHEEAASETGERVSEDKPVTYPPKPPSNGIINIPRAQARLKISPDDWEIARVHFTDDLFHWVIFSAMFNKPSKRRNLMAKAPLPRLKRKGCEMEKCSRH